MDVDSLCRAHIEANNKPLESIFMYKHCAVRGLDNFWYRALVEETSSKGKVRPQKALVRTYGLRNVICVQLYNYKAIVI